MSYFAGLTIPDHLKKGVTGVTSVAEQALPEITMAYHAHELLHLPDDQGVTGVATNQQEALVTPATPQEKKGATNGKGNNVNSINELQEPLHLLHLLHPKNDNAEFSPTVDQVERAAKELEIDLDDPVMVKGLVEMLTDKYYLDKGQVPLNYTARTLCKRCKTTVSIFEGCPEMVEGCPWCHRRKRQG